jgi:drug/metabolite transporter (DMT)-like permease
VSYFVKWKIPILFIVGIIGISFSAIFVKWTSAPTSMVAMYRLLIAAICMLPFVYSRKHEWAMITLKQWIQLYVSGLFLGLHFLLWMESLRYTSVASSTAILTLEPVFVMLASVFIFHIRISRAAQFSMLIAIIGAISMGWGDFRFSASALWGDLLSLLGTFGVAIHIVLGKQLRHRISAVVYSFCVFVCAVLTIALYNLYTGYAFIGYSQQDWLMFTLLALVSTLLGHHIFNWLLKEMNATSVSMAVLGEPLGATILAYFLLHESISWMQMGAGLLLVLGVALFIQQNERDVSPATSSDALTSREK